MLFDQQRGNQEARQHEEDIHPEMRRVEYDGLFQKSRKARRVRRVTQQDEQYRYPSQSIDTFNAPVPRRLGAGIPYGFRTEVSPFRVHGSYSGR
jgi:hypothetical protein